MYIHINFVPWHVFKITFTNYVSINRLTISKYNQRQILPFKAQLTERCVGLFQIRTKKLMWWFIINESIFCILVWLNDWGINEWLRDKYITKFEIIILHQQHWDKTFCHKLMKINCFFATKEGSTLCCSPFSGIREAFNSTERAKHGKRNENGTLHSIGQSDD